MALAPLARIAYNYRWSWTPGGRELFRRFGSHRFSLSEENPVRFLWDLPDSSLEQAAADEDFVARLGELAALIDADLARPSGAVGDAAPVAFLCAEFAVHRSLPIYSGGLGILAGDLLKEASDQGVPCVGVGLFYRRGYFHQRLDRTGWQREYWTEVDPETLPAVRVTDAGGDPVTVEVPVFDTRVVAQIWRVEVGRVPLFLLDAELPENAPIERWITARLYEGNREIRLAQYALLGVGGVKALEAMSVEPALFHLNEGHAALASLAAAAASGDEPAPGGLAAALARGRARFVFTTHTPVAAGNETYSADEILSVMGSLVDDLGFGRDELLALGRVDPRDPEEPGGMTPLAIRASRSTNAVSARHQAVANEMWRGLLSAPGSELRPISHVTNGVHLPTWMAAPMRRLLTSHFGPGWERHAADPALWAGVEDIPDEDLWAARCAQRDHLVTLVRRKAAVDRLARGEDIDYVRAGAESFDPSWLTVGFARRLATYKRLDLLLHDTGRALELFDHDQPMQFLVAGKAHPLDDAGKDLARGAFSMKGVAELRGRAVFLEDYDLSFASRLIAGCDVWLNLPRPPLEASGTSGMKAAMNGCLNLSVLDGWWAEAYDGSNGWAIDGDVDADYAAKDARDAAALYDLMEKEVKPLFFDRDERGIPVAWLRRVRSSMRTLCPRFCATRMLDDYKRLIYRQ